MTERVNLDSPIFTTVPCNIVAPCGCCEFLVETLPGYKMINLNNCRRTHRLFELEVEPERADTVWVTLTERPSFQVVDPDLEEAIRRMDEVIQRRYGSPERKRSLRDWLKGLRDG